MNKKWLWQAQHNRGLGTFLAVLGSSESMNTDQILELRLHNTGLSGSPFKTPADAVGHLGAVQAQDFAAAKWALGLRVRGATDAAIERAFDQGAILRTHVLRPTWHFVRPEDIRWLLALTAPRVKAAMASSNRKLELDDALLARSNATIVKAVRSRGQATRKELKEALEKAGIETNVQRLAHIVMFAELDGLICSGPRRGKQFTYALMEERAPQAPARSRSGRAPTSPCATHRHGPAELQDFAWWSGLAVQEAEQALALAGPALKPTAVGGKTYWSAAGGLRKASKPPLALLLSLFDEYLIAYKDKTVISNTRDVERLIVMGNALTAVIVLGGKVAGTWKRNLREGALEIRLSPFRRLLPAEREALKVEAARYGKFLGVPATADIVARILSGPLEEFP
jgi:hypothetical protein